MSQNLIKKDYSQEDQGDPLPAKLAYGPLEQRRCQDMLFCSLFTLFWVGLITIAGVAVNEGDPKRVASPFDSSGNQCGYDTAESYPYMFFSSQNLAVSQKIYACVKTCPTSDSQPLDCLVNESVKACDQLQSYDSHPFITVCVPASTTLMDTIKSKIDIGSIEQIVNDIETTWPVILGVTLISFGFSLIFLMLMRACAGFVTWSLIVGYFTVLITLGILCLHKSYNNNFDQLPAAFQNEQLLSSLGFILLVTAAISLTLFICFFNKIRKAIAVIKAASDFTRDVWQSFVIPVIMSILIAAFFAFWIVISLHIISSGEVVQTNKSPFGQVNWGNGVERSLIYYLFGLFWNVELLLGMSQLIIASCAAMWYFSHRQSSNLSNPVSKSLFRAFTYHIGSVCFGSMILSIVLVIKFFVESFYREMKKNLRGNAAASCCVKSCICCLRFFENFIRFINNNAYIMIGLTGNHFCGSAKQAFFLVQRNATQFSITQGIGEIFVFIGQIFISSISTLLGYIVITNIDTYSSNIYSASAPTFLFAVISFTVASIFMNIYGVAADTLLMCLYSDKELNKGRPASCPLSLEQFEEALLN